MTVEFCWNLISIPLPLLYFHFLEINSLPVKDSVVVFLLFVEFVVISVVVVVVMVVIMVVIVVVVALVVVVDGVGVVDVVDIVVVVGMIELPPDQKTKKMLFYVYSLGFLLNISANLLIFTEVSLTA